MYLRVENWEDCDVILTKMDNRLWVGVGVDDNFAMGYADAKQLYRELKRYLRKETIKMKNKNKAVRLNRFFNSSL